MLGNFSVPLVGIIDTAVVGHLSDPRYLATVAFGAASVSLVLFLFSFLRMGTGGLVAQASGAGDLVAMRRICYRSMAMAFALGGLIALCSPGLVRVVVLLSGSGANLDELLPQYLYPRLLAAPAALANFVILGALISLERAGVALVLQLVLNSCNILLDLVFVYALDWTVAGVALASAVSELVACVLGLWMVNRALQQRGANAPDAALWRARGWLRLLTINRDILIRSACLVACFYTLPVVGARFGEVTLAANGVLMNFFLLASYTLDGFAHAAEVQTGVAYGARNKQLLRAHVVLGTQWSLATATVITTLYTVCGPIGLQLLTSIPEVSDEASRYLPWLIASPLLGVLAFQMDGVYFGTTHSAVLRNAMLICCLLYAALLLICVPAWQNHGLWFAFSTFMLARGLLLAARYPSIERGIPTRCAD